MVSLGNIGRKISGTRMGGMTGLGLGFAGLAGVGSGIGSSAKNAAFDYAFDDPNADEAFMGRPMSSAFLLSAGTYGATGANLVSGGSVAIGGLVGGASLAKLIPKSKSKGRLLGIGVGAAVGSKLGSSMGGMSDYNKTYLPIPDAASVGVATGALATVFGAAGAVAGHTFKKGVKGGLIGGAIGGVIGGSIGAASGPLMLLSRARSNKELLNSSPYNSSLATSQALNASGDIVFGMHNSRSSY